jgi:flavin-dependent dehydrogenase
VSDLLIFGAGPAGLAAAIRARQRGLTVRLLDKPQRHRPRLGESLSPAAGPVLQELGAWEGFLADDHLPCPGNRWIWGSPELAFHSFTRDPRGQAWHLDRSRFERRLRSLALASGAELEELHHSPEVRAASDGWEVGTGLGASRSLHRARFLLDASGRSASIARALGARRLVTDRQVALLRHFRPEGSPLRDRTSLVEAAADGWWYASLLPNGDLALLLFTDPRRGAELAGDLQQFSRLLGQTRCLSLLAARCRPITSTRVVAAGSAHLDRVAGRGWRAVGDAALSYDPLASHGLTFSLASGRDAADSLADALAGDPQAACLQYQERIDRARCGYAASRRRIYAAENRWPLADYWRRRR